MVLIFSLSCEYQSAAACSPIDVIIPEARKSIGREREDENGNKSNCIPSKLRLPPVRPPVYARMTYFFLAPVDKLTHTFII